MNRTGRCLLVGASLGVVLAGLGWLVLFDPELHNLPAFAFMGALGGLLNGFYASRVDRDRYVRLLGFGVLSYLPTALVTLLLFGEIGFYALVFAPLYTPFVLVGALVLEVLTRDELPFPIRRFLSATPLPDPRIERY